MRSEKWRHSTGFSHPPTSGHTHTLTQTCYTQTIFFTRTKSLRGCTHSHCSSSPSLPNTQVHLKTWFCLTYTQFHTQTNTHVFGSPRHACIIETQLARWLSPDIWLTKPVTHNPREELNSVILLQRRRMQCDAFMAEELSEKEKRRGMSLYVLGQRRKAHTVQQNDEALFENHVAFDIHGGFCQVFVLMQVA